MTQYFSNLIENTSSNNDHGNINIAMQKLNITQFGLAIYHKIEHMNLIF